jgi:hypothetical protein
MNAKRAPRSAIGFRVARSGHLESDSITTLKRMRRSVPAAAAPRPRGTAAGHMLALGMTRRDVTHTRPLPVRREVRNRASARAARGAARP